ncbi:MAG: hypothetical protein K0S76_1095 [Herbinix sp.]|jgi:NitT/TauT family transport system ATP-binding protein|nr:hypothetical protein [Herbinix sp.]
MDIKLCKISKQFEGKQVLTDFDATFMEGQIHCLMGASGIGKTTVINLLMGLIKPDGGAIKGLRGRRIAAVFQEDRLIEHWDAVENVLLVCDKHVKKETVLQEFAKVGLTENMDKAVMNLSGGMRRRVAVIRALLAESDLIVMDEPFKGLDQALKISVVNYIKLRLADKTAIIVTHDKEDVQLLDASLITMF